MGVTLIVCVLPKRFVDVTKLDSWGRAIAWTKMTSIKRHTGEGRYLDKLRFAS